jgi:hypothetical protein
MPNPQASPLLADNTRVKDPALIQARLGKVITRISGCPQVESMKNIHFVGISIFRFWQSSGGLQLPVAIRYPRSFNNYLKESLRFGGFQPDMDDLRLVDRSEGF